MKALILTGSLFLVLTILILFRQLCQFIYRLGDPNILDVIPFLIEVDRDRLEELLDPIAEHYLRMNLGEKQFRKAQQQRMKLLLELVGRMDRNARTLLALGRRERKRAWKAGEPEWQKLGEELVGASLDFHGGAIAIRLTLHKRLIKLAVLPLGRIPNLASLRAFEGFDLFDTYQKMVDAALNLADAYGDEVREKLACAL